LSDKQSPDNPGIYIHIPFCIKKCAYCNFFSVEDLSLQSEYIKALISEIKLKKSKKKIIDTIYFGGGTPSTLCIDSIEQILSQIYKNFNIKKNPEITMEVNPGTIDKSYLFNLRSFGINRLNIGVQSFQNNKLKFLGRIHSAELARKAIEYAFNAGFKNIGIDLIYGVPMQNKQDWIKDLNIALSYKFHHLSCYMLTLEKNTPLYENFQNNKMQPLSKDDMSDFFIITSDILTENKYIHYEISNFALNIDLKSKHNQKYWDHTSYFGFGAGAHSFNGSARFWNYLDIKKYIKALKKRNLPIDYKEVLTKEQKIMETIMLGLRTKTGIDLKKLNDYSDADFDNILICLEKDNLGKKENNYFSLTQKGMCYLDDITQSLIDII